MTITHRLDNFSLEEFTKVAAEFGQERFGYVVTPNADHLIRYHDDASFRAAYAEASYVLLDSRVLALLFKWFLGVRAKVCTGSDLTAKLFDSVLRPLDPIVLIGGAASQAQLLAQRYQLQNLHHFNPPMGFIRQAQAVEECLQFVEAHSPFRFCILGVGAPQQEMVAQQLKARGKARGLVLCAGASIDFVTGAERRAPRFMQRSGLEWLYRLLSNPRRLAHRYLIRGPRVVGLVRKSKVILRQPAA